MVIALSWFGIIAVAARAHSRRGEVPPILL
jgi:hypothetical protein